VVLRFQDFSVGGLDMFDVPVLRPVDTTKLPDQIADRPAQLPAIKQRH
jgi:hypothetical protein